MFGVDKSVVIAVGVVLIVVIAAVAAVVSAVSAFTGKALNVLEDEKD